MVIIHTMPESTATIVVRPFLNWSVALFVFLSGLLTPRSKVERPKIFYARRIHKILIPYLVWSALYILSDLDGLTQHGTAHIPIVIAVDLISGHASAQLYYCVVYLCLVILTPVIYRILDSHFWWIAYAVTPMTFLLKYACTPLEIPAIWAPFFGSWMIFYVVGLDWRTRFSSHIQRHTVIVWSAAALILTLIQLAEGFLWQSVGNYDVATSQLKFSSMLSSLAVIVLLMRIHQEKDSVITGRNIITRLGDLSFGIYLSHLFVVRILLHFLPNPTVFSGFFYGLLSLAVTALCVTAISRIVPNRIRGWIGFV